MKFIEYLEEKNTSYISLNRPNKLNALNYSMIMEIILVLEAIRKDKKIRAIVFEGKGKGFCSGDDLESMGPEGLKFKPLEDGSQIPHQKMLKLITTIPKPVIARIHGFCFGAGFELALACDFRIVSNDLEIGDHRINRAIGILCGASWLLPRVIGFGRAIDIIQTGKHLTANEAFKIGLVSRVYEKSKFKDESKEFIEYIANLPTKCFGYNKQMLNFSLHHDFTAAIKNEFKLYCKNMASKDFWEGIKSFQEKRDPKFVGG